MTNKAFMNITLSSPIFTLFILGVIFFCTVISVFLSRFRKTAALHSPIDVVCYFHYTYFVF